MLNIKTTAKFINILKAFEIDIKALEYALSFILNIYTNKYLAKHITLKITCRAKNKSYGEYNFVDKKIVMCTPSLNDKKEFLSALLHEFRHWIQHSIDGISPIAILSEGIKYQDNAYEQQCVKFEEEICPILINLIEQYSTIQIHFQ